MRLDVSPAKEETKTRLRQIFSLTKYQILGILYEASQRLRDTALDLGKMQINSRAFKIHLSELRLKHLSSDRFP